MKKENAELRKAIVEMDDGILSIEEVQSLNSFIPTPEEVQHN